MGEGFTIPYGELTILQPLTRTGQKAWNWRGLIPESLPVLKPVPAKTALPPLKEPSPTGLVAKEPVPIASPPKIVRKPPVVQPEPPRFKRRAKAAIIIDDVGFVQGPADAMLQVPLALTWAVLPHTPHGPEYIEAARKRGFEIMLHLPLEPINNKINPGPGLIRTDWPEERITAEFDSDLGQVPGAVGLNNHMGSLGTSNERLMDVLLKAVKRKGLFFIDSNTGDSLHRPVVEKFARIHGVPYAKNQVFIDNANDIESKKAALRKLIKLALEQGEAIGIGHVREGTAEVIIEMIPDTLITMSNGKTHLVREPAREVASRIEECRARIMHRSMDPVDPYGVIEIPKEDPDDAEE
jgi:polysaccharide deacetylase 2 family uncharacterized protein YibQ